MKESVLQYVWQHRLYQTPLVTSDGCEIEVINPGQLNRDAGPDFFCAWIKMNGVTLVGNVEIHVKASDWHRHSHSSDPRYDSVILHVVSEDDAQITLPNGRVIPQVCLQLTQKAEEIGCNLAQSADDIRCAKYWNEELTALLRLNISRLCLERLNTKASILRDLHAKGMMRMDDMLYVLLCRAMGGNTNQTAFEALALALPLNVIGKKADSIENVEALLLGCAGLLRDIDEPDDYTRRLQMLYSQYEHIYELRTLDTKVWKFARMRPSSFPAMRIAQLAAILFNHLRLFTRCQSSKSADELMSVFTAEASPYWHTHYAPSRVSKEHRCDIGDEVKRSIIINAVCPTLFAYGDLFGNEDIYEQALSILESLPAEDNAITRQWSKQGIEIKSAAESQALIWQRKNYCDRFDCLRCPICNKILKM